VAIKDISQIKTTLNDIQKQIQRQKDRDKNLVQYKGLMGLPVKKNVEFEEMEQKFNDRKLLWTNIEKFAKKSQDWLNNQFVTLEVEEIEKDMKFFEMSNIQLQMRVSNLSDTNQDKVLDFFIIEVKSLNVQMPLISALGNKDLRPRHWKQIFEALNPTYQPGKQFTFQELVERGVLEKKDLVEDVSGRASGEAQIEAQLEAIKKKWSELVFEVFPYRDAKDKFIIKGIEDIMTALDDH
jgi:dynein heavy chain